MRGATLAISARCFKVAVALAAPGRASPTDNGLHGIVANLRIATSDY
jgi:hypothetical protein